MSCIKKEFSRFQSKPLKTFWGLILMFAIVAITILLMRATLPDANHIIPCIILLLHV